jgi:hypothetical protein
MPPQEPTHTTPTPQTFTAFTGEKKIASGGLTSVLARAFEHRGARRPLLFFDDLTGRQVDFDLRGSLEVVLARAEGRERPGPGRPRLGVVSREVSLLPRHWDWLEAQPNGISAALRRLVDEARKRAPGEERARAARDAASRFMWSMAGNLPGFEEASRALFANDRERLEKLTSRWPKDVRSHVVRMAWGSGS